MKLFIVLLGLVATAQSFALNCSGTEPFWSADLSDNSLVIKYPIGEKDEVESVIAKVEAPFGITKEFMSVYSDSRGPVAVVSTRECSDGMSDEEYPKEITIFTDTGTLYGCCK